MALCSVMQDPKSIDSEEAVRLDVSSYFSNDFLKAGLVDEKPRGIFGVVKLPWNKMNVTPFVLSMKVLFCLALEFPDFPDGTPTRL